MFTDIIVYTFIGIFCSYLNGCEEDNEVADNNDNVFNDHNFDEEY